MRNFILAAAALAGALFAAQPAAAQYAFGFSGHDGNEGLFSDGGSAGTGGFQGWVGTGSSNVGGPTGNTNYIVGDVGGTKFNNYFVFDIRGFEGPVTNAALQLSPNEISGDLVYTLRDATRLIPLLSNAVSPNQALYDALRTGTSLGAFNLNSGQTGGALLLFSLNAAGIDALNAHIANGDTFFALGGTVDAGLAGVPEPMTWALMIGGFGLAGAALRRRRVLLVTI